MLRLNYIQLLSVYIFITLHCVYGEPKPNIEDIIDDIFDKNGFTENAAGRIIVTNCASGKAETYNCLPNNNCDNSGVDFRSGSGNSDCPSLFDVCCAGNRNCNKVANPTPNRPKVAIVTQVPVDPEGPTIIKTCTSGKVQIYFCAPNYNKCDNFGTIDFRSGLSSKDCPSWSEVCCAGARYQTSNEVVTSFPKGCGIRNVGGIDFTLTGATQNEAGFGEFPWTVALLHVSNYSYFCAGSLIHPQVVLTAVHCVLPHTPGSFLIRAGEWDAQKAKRRLPFQEKNAKRIITHPQFNPRNFANDFALVILDSAITLADNINVVCLPRQNAVPAPRTTCFSTGLGKDDFGISGKYRIIMKRVPLPIVQFKVCQKHLRQAWLGPRFVLDRSFVCAGGESGIDKCETDSGAPLVCPIGVPSDNRYQQIGIVAWGIGCSDNIPAVYANVAMARSWIDEQMLANGFGIDGYSA